MKITKSGKIVPFSCNSCDCEFAVGIHVVSTPDKGENYYANCPMCGAECHTDIARMTSVKKMDLEEQKDDLISREEVLSGMIKYGFIAPDMTAHEFVEDELHSVPAVPLDKLCEFLEKCGADSYCGTCKQIMGGCFTDGKGCGSEHFWKELLTKWMEVQDAR